MVLRKSTAVLAVFLAFGAALAAAPAQSGIPTAQAEDSVVLTAENSALFLPASYEQYLELDAPSDAAFSGISTA